MLSKIRQFFQLWQYLGIRWLAYRMSYKFRLRTGIIRRQIPAKNWSAYQLSSCLKEPVLANPQTYLEYRRNRAPSFFFKPEDQNHYSEILTPWDRERKNPIIESNKIANGKLCYFGHTTGEVGFPPNWHTNPFNGQKVPAHHHWSQIDDFAFGDIRVIWEASRFGFVYPLVRAYWRTKDERFPEVFWQLVEDWRRKNPPQRGANWKCGQEISFRVMAWCFGLYGFLNSPTTIAERFVKLAEAIAVSGDRINANLNYALSQHNNHGISEGMGLWTIGLLFPEFLKAEKWRELGRQVLEDMGNELIYEDGSFSQHSVNYHRLMLHDYLWSIRLGELNSKFFSDELKDKVRKAAAFLYQIQDRVSGQVPYYGQNDGSRILPLNNCDYQDFRPVVQATHYLCNRVRCYTSGQWDEDLLWLFGPESLNAPVVAPQRSDFKAEIGGYYTMRSPKSFVFTRCATFRHRPGHADMFHVDLWWRGQNIAVDPGTYSYNDQVPWNNPLAQTSYHNTVTVDGLDQMERVSKFLWLPWLKSWVHQYRQSDAAHLAYWEGEHNGYQHLKSSVKHRRAILRLGNEYWVVCDSLGSRGKHLYRLHWLFPDIPHTWNKKTGHLILQTNAGSYHVKLGVLSSFGHHSLVRGDALSPCGWQAAYYGSREPALSVETIAHANSINFTTIFGPKSFKMMLEKNGIRVKTMDWEALIDLKTYGTQLIIKSVSVSGEYNETLEVSR